MSLSIFCIVLFAALLHASWNAIVKRGADTLLTTILVTGSAAILAVIGLPFLPAPQRRAGRGWPPPPGCRSSTTYWSPAPTS
jgi:hypothetical protein